MSLTKIVVDRLDALERENALLKSQIRALRKEVKENKKPDESGKFSAISNTVSSIKADIKTLPNSRDIGNIKGRMTKLESSICDIKKLAHKEHDHKDIKKELLEVNKEIKKLEAHKDHNHKKTESNIAELHLKVKKLESVKTVECQALSKAEILELIRSTIDLKHVNKLYGKK